MIEAVPEDPGLKAQVLTMVEDGAADAYLGTNTSALSIDELATSLRRLENFIGLRCSGDLVEQGLAGATI